MSQVNFCILMAALFTIPNTTPITRTVIAIGWVIAAIYLRFA